MSNHWIKVEFYGRPPDGQTVTSVDAFEIGQKLAEVFGFEEIDGLVVVKVEPEPDLVRPTGW